MKIKSRGTQKRNQIKNKFFKKISESAARLTTTTTTKQDTITNHSDWSKLRRPHGRERIKKGILENSMFSKTAMYFK